MMGTRWSRWHRYDAQGNKQIKNFAIGTTPNPLKEDCFTEWKLGTGPFSHEDYITVVNAVRKAVGGKPKSQQTKEKMSKAHKGVPKSEEHRKSMSLAQKGKKKSEEHRKSMSVARLRMKQNET